MKPNKAPSKTSMMTRFKRFMDALSERYQTVLQIIDEALASDNLRDKSWAVDVILKRCAAPAESAAAKNKNRSTAPTSSLSRQSLSQLSQEELLQQIRQYLPDVDIPDDPV